MHPGLLIPLCQPVPPWSGPPLCPGRGGGQAGHGVFIRPSSAPLMRWARGCCLEYSCCSLGPRTTSCLCLRVLGEKVTGHDGPCPCSPGPHWGLCRAGGCLVRASGHQSTAPPLPWSPPVCLVLSQAHLRRGEIGWDKMFLSLTNWPACASLCPGALSQPAPNLAHLPVVMTPHFPDEATRVALWTRLIPVSDIGLWGLGAVVCACVCAHTHVGVRDAGVVGAV